MPAAPEVSGGATTFNSSFPCGAPNAASRRTDLRRFASIFLCVNLPLNRGASVQRIDFTRSRASSAARLANSAALRGSVSTIPSAWTRKPRIRAADCACVLLSRRPDKRARS